MVIEYITESILKIIESIGSLSNLSIGNAIMFDIAIMVIIAAFFAFIARILKQPLIPAYVITGILIGPIALGFVRDAELIYTFSEIGIAFLLFAAGLEISIKKIKEANIKKIIVIGLLQIIATVALTLLLANYLNLDFRQAIYLGIVLSFSSTMITTKILSEKGELITLHGRLALGILLLQDLVAIVAIGILIAGNFSLVPILMVFVKIIAMILIAVILNLFVINSIFRFAARSMELLFLCSLAVLFLFVFVSSIFGLGIVIGAFIAGVSLANSTFKIELESRIIPLRDFFAILFFVALGMQIITKDIQLSLLLYLLIGAIILKPLILFLFFMLFGYKSKTRFVTSLTLAQLSEFSLILGLYGLEKGIIGKPILSTIILSTIASMAISSYFIKYKNNIYYFLSNPFKSRRKKKKTGRKRKKSILVLGAHRIGSIILKNLSEEKKDLLIIDHNPEIIRSLKEMKIDALYGDITSPEIFEKIDIKNLKLVISSVPDYEDNLRVLKKIKEFNNRTPIILTATRISEALELYMEGADYVILPKVIAGKEISNILNNRKKIKKLRKKQMKLLNKIHNILY
jgi:Kef-type K+ transport system membrane component KefB